MLIQHNVNIEDEVGERGTDWVPSERMLLSDRLENESRTNHCPYGEYMKALEALLYGPQAGTEEAGLKLIAMQMDPTVEDSEVHLLSEEVVIKVAGTTRTVTVMNREEIMKKTSPGPECANMPEPVVEKDIHTMEYVMQIQMNVGGKEALRYIPYIRIGSEYKKNTPPNRTYERVYTLGELRNYRVLAHHMPVLVRQNFAHYMTDVNKEAILSAHVERLKNVWPDDRRYTERQIMDLIMELPVQWIIEAGKHTEAVGIDLGRNLERFDEEGKPITILPPWESQSGKDGKASEDLEEQEAEEMIWEQELQEEEARSKKRRKLGRLVGLGRGLTIRGGGSSGGGSTA